jgi:RNA polymerase-binding protein DksA
MEKKTHETVAIRKRLLEEKQRLEDELAEIEERTTKTAEMELATEPSGYEDHPADIASETFEREKDLAMAESVQTTLRRVNEALDKLDHGTYGRCDSCGQPISEQRLKALPFATLCVTCQERSEIR